MDLLDSQANALETLYLKPAQFVNEPSFSWKHDVDFVEGLSMSKVSTSVVLSNGECKEVLLDQRGDSKTSTLLNREPDLPGTFVRGKTTNVPFTPGGLESIALVDDLELYDLQLDEDLYTVPPGFVRGLKPTRMELKLSSLLDVDPFESFLSQPVETEHVSLQKETLGEKLPVDELLPEDSTLPILKKPSTGKKEWAHVVNLNQELEDWDQVVPEMAHEYPFELDPFQKQAIYHLERNESVFVAAHTSAGKTVVAEYAISLAMKHMTKAIYTSPIKALSNQKFRDFRTTYGEDEVGILTGDVQIKPEAPCLVMTTEILRSMLYRGADLIRDVEFVIFDEVHYVNDSERGVVWEEVIIMLPAHVNLILLSATVPNTMEFAGWVGRTKKKDIYVISTPKRPVPLEYFLFLPTAGPNNNGELFKVVDEHKKFLMQEWKRANDSTAAGKKELDKKLRPTGRGTPMRGQATIKPVSTGRNASIGLYTHLVNQLKKRVLLPVVIFTFSKRKCEEYADALANTDLTGGSGEKSEIHVFIERSIVRLTGTDKELPQILRMRDMLSRGIGVHHSGLLPIMKEVVEILFARGLVKVLFATETFAMGVNMPAKTVVFSSTRKHDGKNFRELLPGEFTQMSGRAGRRGLDTTGTVILMVPDEIPEVTGLQQMILGTPTRLESQFRLTYTMILNLLRIEALKVEDMIQRSFGENATQKLLPEQQKQFEEAKQSIKTLPKLSCMICEGDIEEFYTISSRIVLLSNEMRDRFIAKNPAGVKALLPGRVVVVNNPLYRNTLAVLTGITDKGYEALLLVDDTEEQEALPLPIMFVNVPKRSKLLIRTISLQEITIVTKHTLRVEERDESEYTKLVQQLYSLAVETQQVGRVAEYDWSKIRALDFQERLRERDVLMKRLVGFQCLACPELNQHYGVIHVEHVYKDQLENLAHRISDQNLALLPDFHQRVEVLKRLKFVDEETSTVELKGRVACEINTADELVLTELILDNVLAEYEPEEIVALLSCFVFQERSDSEPQLTERLEQGLEVIKQTATRIAQVQRECALDVSVEDYLADGFKMGLVEVVYWWAKGVSFKEVTQMTDVLEGSIVRCIVRLDETCREVRSAARAIGSATLFQKMEIASELIRRDIVFSASLYF